MYIPVPPHKIGSLPLRFISLIDPEKVMLILKYVIFIAGLADIDQVIGDLFSIHVVIGQILTVPISIER